MNTSYSQKSLGPWSPSEREFELAEEAFDEWKRTGATSRDCPYCSAELSFFDGGSGYSIKCISCQLSYTVRGI